MSQEDKLKDIDLIVICGVYCYKRWWKYYRRFDGRYLGFTLLEAESRLRELIGDTKLNIQ